MGFEVPQAENCPCMAKLAASLVCLCVSVCVCVCVCGVSLASLDAALVGAFLLFCLLAGLRLPNGAPCTTQAALSSAGGPQAQASAAHGETSPWVFLRRCATMKGAMRHNNEAVLRVAICHVEYPH